MVGTASAYTLQHSYSTYARFVCPSPPSVAARLAVPASSPPMPSIISKKTSVTPNALVHNALGVTVTDFLNDANKVILVICDFFRQISAKICAKVNRIS